MLNGKISRTRETFVNNEGDARQHTSAGRQEPQGCFVRSEASPGIDFTLRHPLFCLLKHPFQVTPVF